MNKLAKIVVFGNSGAGKSTLAKRCADSGDLMHLDLDTIAWDEPGVRKDRQEGVKLLGEFISKNPNWVIEGCYASLISVAALSANQLVFLNVGIENCLQNCRNREWEPHKYESKQQQDENLQMLLDWVADYETRTGEFSLVEHQAIFDRFEGRKFELKSMGEVQSWAI